MEIVIVHKKGQSVSNDAELDTVAYQKDDGGYGIKKIIKIKNIYHLQNEPESNELVTVHTKDKEFSCIFVNNHELKITT